jgi:hypothetical protein
MKQHSFLKKTLCLVAAVAMFASQALATPTALTTTNLVLNNTNPSAGGLAISLTACDATNGNSYTFTGQEVLLVYNSDSSAHTFTITTVADQWGGTNSSFTNYSVAATSYAAVQMKYPSGFNQSGVVDLTCSSNLLKYAVLHYY